ncbi:hypothetical protein P691DRAFT_266471 [Macrolepiota fuliginosa MF-IS2]|uniref:Uncharacterized protein n=1 Tax=Macrolepiota fuliginosa MF-IS2 TaxID=1400762 RepID=A0A9P5X9C6_9AGAR|nr:hypothetical protein P691DRAFT_266471 [Macrolepiota fuliginosa MF-IS2]
MAGLPGYLIAYDVLSFASALLIALTILTVILSKQLYRGKGWFGLMSCWLVYSISYGLLVGRQIGAEPSFSHCFAQTVFIYAAPPLVGVGTLCFYLDFYLGSCWDPSRRCSLRPAISWLLLALPWMVHIAIDLEVVIVAVRSNADPVVERIESNLYCHLQDNSVPGMLNAALVVLSMVLLIPLEGIQLYRSRSIRSGADFRQYLSVYIRIAACTIVASVAFGLSAITLVDVKSDSLVQDLSFPCLSMAVSLIFASQQDLLNVWFCRRAKKSTYSFVRSVDRSLPEEPKTFQHKSDMGSESSKYSEQTLYPS